ncbi:MAG TPA: ComEC/Rec2 family competence protein [Patescibacteria group bacterium]
MHSRRIILVSLFFLLITALILSVVIFYSKSQELKVIFLDVGQGDAILIEQGQNQILIDGGSSGQTLLEKLGKYVPFWDRKIEIVIATHPDADHIGGLIDVMRTYQIGEIMDTQTPSDSQIYKKYREIIDSEKIAEVEGVAGVNIKIGDSAEMKIVSPVENYNPNEKDTNLNSIVARLKFGENSFLFTGDLPSDGEQALIKTGENINSQVLKVGHHGSKYSTGEEFLKVVNPRDAVISVGANNRYGHPAPEILERLRNMSINIFRTDERRDIEYVCEGVDKKCDVMLN